MNIENLNINDLKPAPYNPRVDLEPGDPRFERLVRSLTEFDLVQPLVWNRVTGHLVGGHQRLAILKHHGMKEVPCVVVEMSLEREKALNIALNNAQVGGDWELDKLAALLNELEQLPDFDASLTGFSSDDLKDLLFVPAEEGAADSEEPHSDNAVRVELVINEELWPEVRVEIDQLIAANHLEAHVRIPGS
ncbi:ParB N-terminal domain-containing protein [Calycomorphotria hydatis]|uniref:ParB-like nuclease domain protein n=1 Tax=Calycomorphotria hydatis TaxID=2528027 RepID=A0A517TFA3_9PLAN|nr:ParB N-terminal domain-containing protein [Calycomorphotria hydatis]QDT67056.1 ParB-like nuclease domain protein [Calycomorphotria hydatis]